MLKEIINWCVHGHFYWTTCTGTFTSLGQDPQGFHSCPMWQSGGGTLPPSWLIICYIMPPSYENCLPCIKLLFCTIVIQLDFLDLQKSMMCGCVIWLYQSSFYIYLYPRPTKLEGGYTGFTLSVCPSVRLSVCRRHGFRSISQVCFGISISNFICMLTVAIGRSLLIFSDVTFKMAAWRPYWIIWFPDSNLTLALNINFKLQRHNTYVYG